MKSSSTAALLATTLFVLFSVAEDVYTEPCDFYVTEHSQLADHSKFISCDYDGPNMTIAWQRPSTEPYYHLQIEYQCFNESLEDISELNKRNNKIALSYYYVLTNSALESVKITNSTCIISGCVKEEGVNNNAMWMDTTVCFPPATDVSVLSSGSVILSTMSSWSGSGSVIPSTMSSWSGYSTMSTSYSISTLPPSVEATTILPTSFYIKISTSSTAVVTGSFTLNASSNSFVDVLGLSSNALATTRVSSSSSSATPSTSTISSTSKISSTSTVPPFSTFQSHSVVVAISILGGAVLLLIAIIVAMSLYLVWNGWTSKRSEHTNEVSIEQYGHEDLDIGQQKYPVISIGKMSALESPIMKPSTNVKVCLEHASGCSYNHYHIQTRNRLEGFGDSDEEIL